MNTVKVLPADTIIGSNHGISGNSNYNIWSDTSNIHGRGVSMNYLDTLLTLLRWKQQGWEVHPCIDTEFTGWF